MVKKMHEQLGVELDAEAGYSAQLYSWTHDLVETALRSNWYAEEEWDSFAGVIWLIEEGGLPKILADSTFEQFETESFGSMIESSSDADAEMSPTKVLTALLGAGALGGTTSTANAFQAPTSMHGGVVARGIPGPGIARTGPATMHDGPNIHYVAGTV